MAIAVKCQACSKALNARDELAGKKVKCPGCGAVLLVPTPAAAAAPAAATPAAAARATPPPLPQAKRPSPPPAPPALPEGPPAPAATGARAWNAKWGFSAGLMAVTENGILFESMSDDARTEAREAIEAGSSPRDVFGPKATCFEYGAVDQFFFNELSKSLDVIVKSGDDTDTKTLEFEDADQRDDAFAAIRELLPEWKYKRKELTALTAALKPLLGLGGTIIFGFFVTYLAYEVNQPDSEFDRTRSGRGRFVGLIMAYTFGLIGHIATASLFFLIALGIVAWMVVRMRTPPIEVSLKP